MHAKTYRFLAAGLAVALVAAFGGYRLAAGVNSRAGMAGRAAATTAAAASRQAPAGPATTPQYADAAPPPKAALPPHTPALAAEPSPSPESEPRLALASPRPDATAGSNSDAATSRNSNATTGSNAVIGNKGTAQQGVLAGLTIVVDPGHGGDISWNGGATGVTGLLEKDVNLALGLSLRQALERLGARVVMTRQADVPAAYTGEDQEDPLEATTAIAAASGGDLFVSLHGNWSEDPSVEGIETYYYPGSTAGRRAAADLAEALAQNTGLPTRGPLANNYYVLHHHGVPATLLEIGYLSNRGDEALLRTQAFRDRVVAGIVSGIRAYFGR